MRFLLLGSAAAEGLPAVFCECENCLQARAAGGKSLRLRASALLNNDLLIDPGPDLVAATQRYGLNLSRLQVCLVTHFHEDHWLADNLLYRHRVFRPHDLPPLQLCGGPRLTSEIEALRNRHGFDFEDFALELHIIKPFVEFAVGNYTVKALPASHTPSVEPFFYAISQGDKRLLYVTDTGPFAEATWEGLTGFGAQLLVMEQTLGVTYTSDQITTHMCREDFLATVARIRKEAVILPDAKIISHHFSHQHNSTQEVLEKALTPHGISVGYDGLEIDC